MDCVYLTGSLNLAMMGFKAVHWAGQEQPVAAGESQRLLLLL